MMKTDDYTYRDGLKKRTKMFALRIIKLYQSLSTETMFWLELLWEAGIVKQELLQDLYQENEEILKIMVVSRKNSEKK